MPSLIEDRDGQACLRQCSRRERTAHTGDAGFAAAHDSHTDFGILRGVGALADDGADQRGEPSARGAPSGEGMTIHANRLCWKLSSRAHD